MVEAADPHSYEVAVKTMTRKKLEEFALRATDAMEALERENAGLRSDLGDAMKIDPEVIDGWRRWNQTVDEEREKWADLATRLTTEMHELKGTHEGACQAGASLLENLKAILERANEDSEEGTNSKAMRKALVSIAKQAETAIASYEASMESPGQLPPAAPEEAEEPEAVTSDES